MRVAICICTFKRPAQLRETLRSIGELCFSTTPPEIDVIVVNNDPGTSIENVLDEMRPRCPWRLHGLVEPRRGIPQARNRGVQHARALGADYVAFLDDDEVAQPGWLDRLLACAGQHGAALVQGKVVPMFQAEPPTWARRGDFHDGGREGSGFTPGQRLGYAATNNLLVRSDVFATVGAFDEWWQTQGGDDTEFTLRAARFGFSIVWCPDAVVSEWVPRGRMALGWVLRRGFRSGNTYGLICRRSIESARSHVLLLGCSVVVVVAAMLRAIPACLRGRLGCINAGRHVLFAVGNLMGAAGYKYSEYEKPFVGSDFTPPQGRPEVDVIGSSIASSASSRTPDASSRPVPDA